MNKERKQRGLIVVIFMLVLTLLFVAKPLRTQNVGSVPQVLAKSNRECTLPLRINVRQGPNAGLELFGLVNMNIDKDGATSGTYDILAPKDRVSGVPLVGQIIGRAVSLMFLFPDKTRMFGVGTIENPIETCHGEWGGPVVGPGKGDAGDWACTPDYCCGGGVCMYCQLIGSQNVCVRFQ